MTKSKGDLIYFSSVEWKLFQRPQSLCLEFANRGYRVFYLEPMLSVGNILKHMIEFESLGLPKLSYDNIILLRPYLSLSTFRFGATKRIDRKLFNMWFSMIKQRYDLKEDALIFISLPYWWNNIIDRNVLSRSTIIYDCVDDTKVQARNELMLSQMEKAEYDLASDSDFCFTTASELHNKIKTVNASTHMLPNAINPNFFISKCNYTPSDVDKLARPILGFVGSLYDHIDFNVFEKIAEFIKEGTIVLVGLTNRKDDLSRLLAKHKNIYYAGAKPYEEVPAYINSFDVCLNPFNIDEIGNSVNPLKLYEYLIFGKPVISSKTKEMEKYSDFVYLYSNYDELGKAVQLALSEQPLDKIRQYRIKFATENSWESRVDEVERLLGL